MFDGLRIGHRFYRLRGFVCELEYNNFYKGDFVVDDMIAKIQVKKVKSPGGAVAIERRIQGALRSRQHEGVRIRTDKAAGTVYVNVGFPQKELEKLLGSITGIPHSVEYVDDSPETVTVEVFPADYGLLRGREKELAGKVKGLEDDVLGHMQSLSDVQRENRELQMAVKDLESRCEIKGAKDTLADLMARESVQWKAFVENYSGTLAAAAEVYGIPVDVLEREVLNYQEPMERDDFQRIAVDFHRAKDAKEAVKLNPLLRVDDYAQQVLEKGERILARGATVLDVRKDLEKYADGRKMVIMTTKEKRESLVTLPFKKKDVYSSLEVELVTNINQSLTDSGMDFTQEEFNGLLRYRVPGLKSRAMARLTKAIHNTGDGFTELGGQREMIALGIYAP